MVAGKAAELVHAADANEELRVNQKRAWIQMYLKRASKFFCFKVIAD